MVWVLIFWSIAGWKQAKLPATAEFNTAAACTGALFAVQNQGFTGICVEKGKAE